MKLSWSWRSLTRAVGLLSLLTFTLAALTPLPNVLGEYSSVPAAEGPADAIVILGAGLMLDGSLSDESMRRFVRGVDLYKRGLAPFVVFLGPPRTDVKTAPEGEVRWELARNLGVPKDAAIVIPDAYTTREEALRTAEKLKGRNAGSILLVTESIHMKRAKRVFEREGFKVLPGSWDRYAATAISASDRLWLSLRIAQESLALIYYQLARYI